MKKIIPIVLAFITIILLINKKEDYYIIPDEAIRLRILANSNSVYDQYIKTKVKQNIEEELKNTITDYNTIENSRKTIKESIPTYEKIVKETLDKEDYNKSFTIDYGYHYFPKKEYKKVVYNEGYYESLLITIGDGEGDNWWCVLFPPLCTLEVEELENQKIEYHIFIKDLIEKYLTKK